MASFEEAVLKTMVAKVCDYVGYNAITPDSVNILVDVYRKTFIHLARHCKEAANNNERVEPTLPDLVQAYNFVGISIPSLVEHAQNVRIPLEFKIEPNPENLKSSNRIQRNLFVDDLLEAEKKQDGGNGNENSNVDKSNDAAGSDQEDNNNMTPLLKDIYNEISTQFPNPPAPIKADKVRVKREEKPIITKLKITPLDPSIAEPPSFLPIIGGNLEEQASFAASSVRPAPTPSIEKPKRGRQKGTKLKLKSKLKTSASVKASAKASAKAVARAIGKTGAKLKTKIKTKIKTKTKGNQAKSSKLSTEKASSPELAPEKSPPPEQPISPPPRVASRPSPSPPASLQKIQISDDALQEAPSIRQQTPNQQQTQQQQSKSKKKRKKSSNQFAIVTETVKTGTAEVSDEVCPACGDPDDGDIMLACDICELWYHLRCTDLTQPPKDNEDWHCDKCSAPISSGRPTPIIPLPSVSTKSSSSKSQSSRSKGKKKSSDSSSKTKTPELKSQQIPTPSPQVPHSAIDIEPQKPAIICTSQDDLCPECQLPDDGTLMIQCDDPACAKWFHGKCVNVLMEPSENDSWFCKNCVVGQQSAFQRRRRPI